jgi:CubicO group peptidase (beta-lactamase class C family)
MGKTVFVDLTHPFSAEIPRWPYFDKPVIDTTLNGTPSKRASRASYGHTGFTGPFVWADPQNKLILVFLTNSIYPNRSMLITKLDLRTKIHDVFYAEDLVK